MEAISGFDPNTKVVEDFENLSITSSFAQKAHQSWEICFVEHGPSLLNFLTCTRNLAEPNFGVNKIHAFEHQIFYLWMQIVIHSPNSLGNNE